MKSTKHLPSGVFWRRETKRRIGHGFALDSRLRSWPHLLLSLVGAGLLAVTLTFVSPSPAEAQQRTRGFCYLDVLVFSGDLHQQDCGRSDQVNCNSGAHCDPGYRPVYFSDAGQSNLTVSCGSLPNEVISAACVSCGGAGEIACLSNQCDGGLGVVTTTGLNGPISSCSEFLPPDPPDVTIVVPERTILGITYFEGATYNIPFPSSASFVTAYGICSDGFPVSLSGASREPWPDSPPPSSERSTIFVIHGRGSSCNSGFDTLLDESIYDRHQLTYCVEYDPQTGDPSNSTPGAAGRVVRILPVLQDRTGEGPDSCVGPAGVCSFDSNNPVAVVTAAELSVEGVAEALAQAIALVPTEGDITLMPASQGGFVARALLHRHYDDLRWQGKSITRVISLGHPYFGVLTDPSLVTGWGCADNSASFKNCHVSRWLWGWQNWLAGAGASDAIDDLDFPQIEWSAIAGDSSLGRQSDALSETFSDACIAIFGGVSNSSVQGDGTVPIQSSLGVDEHGFYAIAALDFDAAIETAGCGHSASCQTAGAISVLGDGLLARTTDRNALTLVFDGAEQVAISDPLAVAALTLTDGLTLEAWVRPTTTSQMIVLSKGEEYRLELGFGGIRWSLGGFGGDDTYGGGSAPLNRWTHIAVTYDASEGVVRTYADGALVDSEGGGGLLVDGDPTNNELRIGGHEDGSFASMVGALDDVRIWSRELTQAEISAGMAGDPGAGNQAGLIAWWRFDETTGDVLLDSSPSGFDASLTSFPEPPRRWGAPREIADGALYFDGVDDRTVVDDPAALAALEVDNALTLEAWVFPRGPGPAAGGAIVSKEGEYQLTRLTDGTAAFTLASVSPGWSTRVTAVSLPERTWTHVALVFDGAQAHLYRNGVLAHTEAAIGPIGDFPSHAAEDELWIGGRQFNLRTGTQQWFDGVVDEVRVWNRARSGAEIAADLHRILDVTTASGLTGYWRFGELETDVALDTSGVHHAELGGGVGAARPARSLRQSVPEPGSWLALAMGIGLLATLSRRHGDRNQAWIGLA